MAERVVGITMVRDEVDIIGETIKHMLGQVDAVVVADNMSTDGTREILDELPVGVVDDNDPAYYQSRKMSSLASFAAVEYGATWVVPFDADEIWVPRDADTVGDALRACKGAVATAPNVNYVATTDDDMSKPPVLRMEWRQRTPLPLPKVACRPVLAVEIAQGNHTAHYQAPDVVEDVLIVRHYPYRSEEQFLSKVRNGAAAYRATDLPPDVGQHWRQYGEMLDRSGEEAVKEWFREYFLFSDPGEAPNLVHDPVVG